MFYMLYIHTIKIQNFPILVFLCPSRYAFHFILMHIGHSVVSHFQVAEKREHWGKKSSAKSLEKENLWQLQLEAAPYIVCKVLAYLGGKDL